MERIVSIFFLPLLAYFSVAGILPDLTNNNNRDTRIENKNTPIVESQYALSINPGNKASVSPLLMGFNVIYPHEKDSIWQDDKIASCLKEVGVGFIRYPGGTVCSYYHWNALTGVGWADSWDPMNPVEPKSGSEFMDIDEYMALVRKTGATPLVGINVSSGWRWDRLQDGLDEAIALMKYCREADFEVIYWYLDNEPYQHDSNGGTKTPEVYAELINAYAPVMKAFDPDIKIVVNWNSGFKNKRNEYDRLLRLAGKNIDVIDVHWYWSWSNTSWEKWFEKTPLVQWTGYTYDSEISYFRQLVDEAGYPDIKLASFEWNTGPVKAGNSLTANRAAFIHTEMMMQFIKGGLDYAVFWPIHWPEKSSLIRSFFNTATGTVNPVFHMFKFLGKMQNGLLLESEIIKNRDNMVSLAVQDEDNNQLRICIINKNAQALVSEIDMVKFPGMTLTEAYKYTVSEDGSMYSLDELDWKTRKPGFTHFVSEGISVTMLLFSSL